MAASKKTASKKTAPKADAKAAKTAAPAAEKAPKAAKTPKEPKPPRERIEANGQVRPTSGTKTGSVWDQADKITAANKSTATRAEVMKWGADNGLAAGMVATQYGRWRRFIGQPGRLAKPEAVAEAAPKGKGKAATA